MCNHGVKNIGRWTQFCFPYEFTGGYFLKKLMGFKTRITITRTI